MEISDNSDSDSTLLVSEPRRKTARHGTDNNRLHGTDNSEHRVVIQVKGPERDRQLKSFGEYSDNARVEGYGYQMTNQVSY